VRIWGEHSGFLKPLSEAYFLALEGKPGQKPFLFLQKKFDGLKISQDEQNWSVQGWLNWFEEKDWAKGYSELLTYFFLPECLRTKRFWGFKEISYMINNRDRTMEFLMQMYPNAYFVFIIRNGFNVLASHKGQHPSGGLNACKNFCVKWRNQNIQMWRWHQSGKLKSYWIRYEDLIAGTGAILELMRDMGKEFGAAQFELLKMRHGRGSSFNDISYNDRWKTLPSSWQSAGYALLAEANQRFGFDNPAMSFLSKVQGRGQILSLYAAQGMRQILSFLKSTANEMGSRVKPLGRGIL
jgi:hypothetical protein